jgi:hypothetical protein
LATTGAVTLTGALNGTSATLNGNSAGGFVGLTIANASTGAAQIALNNSAQSWLVNTRTDNQFSVFNATASTTPFLIATTGAATFSSSVTIGNNLTYGYLYGPSGQIFGSIGANTTWINAGTSGLRFNNAADNTTLMFMSNAGNVGIGTASPQGGGGATDRTLSINSGSGAASFVTGLVGDVKYSTLFTSSSQVTLETNAAIPLTFSTNNTERMRITSDGYARLSASSGGIQFNGDTAAANALDDYEEGAFTPVVEGSTSAGTASYTAQNGQYTKIGRAVSFNIYLDWNSGTGTGDLRVGNLPFTASASGIYPSVTIGEISGITLSANCIATCRVQISSNIIHFNQALVGGGAVSSLLYDSQGYFTLSGTYYV